MSILAHPKPVRRLKAARKPAPRAKKLFTLELTPEDIALDNAISAAAARDLAARATAAEIKEAALVNAVARAAARSLSS